ncbi:LIM domain kinase 1 [Chionoecetes opilio]|uniref:LIM domain kinase 1 n=1 Tax=Chionoecetes opilio TaxID=41210 RepID=A0A8J4XU42_CHIOP|nr:LIM domain kinase 1 [Chionoecetes opilio]
MESSSGLRRRLMPGMVRLTKLHRCCRPCENAEFIGVLYKDKKLHLVTEFISGGTLKEIIHDQEEALPWDQRISFAKDIASGMAYLHNCDIIHRDLNSNNCLVREDKSVVVADFGLARIMPQNNWTAERKKYGKKHARKKRYTVVGNPYWMAPEMMKGNKYDEKVDIFSFGIILCEIIGRVEADPDYMPRSKDFGLNEAVFQTKYCQECPEPFYKIAFMLCNINPDTRPPFEILEVWLEGLAMHFTVGAPIPSNLLVDIYTYNGRSNSSSSEASTPEAGGPDCHQPPPLLRTISEGTYTTNDSFSSTSSYSKADLSVFDPQEALIEDASWDLRQRLSLEVLRPNWSPEGLDKVDACHKYAPSCADISMRPGRLTDCINMEKSHCAHY